MGRNKKKNNDDMNEKEIYRQKKQAQLDEWRADVDKLKAKSSQARADAQLELNKKIEELEGKMEEGKARLAELEEASDDAWDSIKRGVESAWESIDTALKGAVAQFKQ